MIPAQRIFGASEPPLADLNLFLHYYHDFNSLAGKDWIFPQIDP
jgi:hypothetical protein